MKHCQTLQKTFLLMRHFETKHGDLKHKPLEYFQRKLYNLSKSKSQITSFSGISIMAVEASCKIGLRVAKAGKSYTIVELLLCELVLLSNDTISQRISDIALNIKEELIKKVKASNIIVLYWMKVLILATWPILHL
jgi:hypothetical protein